MALNLDRNTAEEDAKYVRACQSGDKTAWDPLYSKYSGKLTRFFEKRKIGNQDAEDLAQDTFVEAFQKINTIRDPKCFNAWLFKIAERKRAKWLNAEDKRVFCEHLLAETEEQSTLNPADLLIREEQQSIRQSAIDRLPEDEKNVIQLRIDGLSYEQIADTLGLTISKVGVLLHRAKAKLKRWLSTEYL